MPGRARPRGRFHARAPMLLAGLLGLTTLLASVYAKVQIDQRDAALAAREQEIGTLTAANAALDEEVHRLGEERDAANDELRRRSADMEQDLEASRRQLEQAQEATTRQQERADAAELEVRAMAGIIQLDNELVLEFATFAEEFVAYHRAVINNDPAGMAAALKSIREVSRRSVDLLKQRAEMLRALSQGRPLEPGPTHRM